MTWLVGNVVVGEKEKEVRSKRSWVKQREYDYFTTNYVVYSFL